MLMTKRWPRLGREDYSNEEVSERQQWLRGIRIYVWRIE